MRGAFFDIVNKSDKFSSPMVPGRLVVFDRVDLSWLRIWELVARPRVASDNRIVIFGSVRVNNDPPLRHELVPATRTANVRDGQTVALARKSARFRVS